MKVLVGIGGTDPVEYVLERVIERSRAAGDDLTVAVLEGPTEGPVDAVERQVRERLTAMEFPADVTIVEDDGHPGSSLVAMAERGGYDRLVLGGGDRSPLGKIQVGPTVEFVLLNADLSVTLVR